MRKQGLVILTVILSFAVYFIGFVNFRAIMDFLNLLFKQGLISYILTYIIIGVPIFAGTMLINRSLNFFKQLGLQSKILTGFLLALLFASPMLIGGTIFYRFSFPVDIPNFIAGTILAGFFEELYFRGFLFGQLFKNTALGFILSIVFGALIFASGHLYQSHEFSTLLGVFLTTFSGAVFFAWLYVEWDYNLWVPVFLHTLMNVSWKVFSVSDNAFGNLNSNVLRGLTIAIAIIVTIMYKRKTGKPLSINRKTLWLRRTPKAVEAQSC